MYYPLCPTSPLRLLIQTTGICPSLHTQHWLPATRNRNSIAATSIFSSRFQLTLGSEVLLKSNKAQTRRRQPRFRAKDTASVVWRQDEIVARRPSYGISGLYYFLNTEGAEVFFRPRVPSSEGASCITLKLCFKLLFPSSNFSTSDVTTRR